jgi:hypothetical protein
MPLGGEEVPERPVSTAATGYDVAFLSRRNPFMMLRLIAFFLLSAASAGSAFAADPVFPPGSRMGFVPPPGFVASKHFPGFEHPDTHSSMVAMMLPAEGYENLEKSISADALKQQGLTEEKRENLTLPSGGKALLVTATEQDREKNQKVRKLMFLGQLKEGVAMIAVMVPEPGQKTISDDMIRASLTTIAVRGSVPMEELLALMPFKLNDLSGLRPVKVLGNTAVVLTYGDKESASPHDQPFFAVAIDHGGPEQAPDRATFARNLFTNLGDVKEVQITGNDMLRLGGGADATHELQAEAKEAFTDTPMKLVQWVRFGQGSFIRMVGIARADQWTTAFPHFRAVRDGIAPHED